LNNHGQTGLDKALFIETMNHSTAWIGLKPELRTGE
jgi:hypothetical protein